MLSCRPFLGTPTPPPATDAATPPSYSYCGHDREACCAQAGAACQAWLSCRPDLIGHSCQPCGTSDAPCCLAGTQCQPGLSCIHQQPLFGAPEDDCEVCGVADGPCCPGSSACGAGLACTTAFGVSTCRPCGASLQPCCPGDACASPLVCGPDVLGRAACVPCGAARQPCCAGDTCGAPDLACVRDFGGMRCAPCGHPGEPCCARACGAGARCHDSRCVAASGDGGVDAGVAHDSPVGGPCVQDVECAAQLVCWDVTAAGFCTARCSAGTVAQEEADCGAGNTCVNGTCVPRCATSSDAGTRCAAGQLCQRGDEAPDHPAGCIPSCRQDSECPAGFHCNPRWLACDSAAPPADGRPDGYPCSPGSDTCRGECLTSGPAAGICASLIDARVTATCPDMGPHGPITPVPVPGTDVAQCWRVDCTTSCDCPPQLYCNVYTDGTRRCGYFGDVGSTQTFFCGVPLPDAGAADAAMDAP